MVSPENIPEETENIQENQSFDEENPMPRRWGGILGLVLLTVVLGFAAILGIQLFSIIYALIFPPNAPLPDNLIEISHENRTYGSDRWVYGTDIDGCELVEFFMANGAQCNIAPGICGSSGFETILPNQQTIGTCNAEVEFSIFAMRWTATIASGYSTEPVTRFDLEQDVLWFGASPQGENSE